jgi:hypothetical protein
MLGKKPLYVPSYLRVSISLISQSSLGEACTTSLFFFDLLECFLNFFSLFFCRKVTHSS